VSAMAGFLAALRATELTIAKRAMRRIKARYPSELDLRPTYFNGGYRHTPTVRKSRVGTIGAARNTFERLMDRQRYWDWSWMRTGVDGDGEWGTRAPFRRTIYPPSVFKGRKKVKHDRQKCQREGCGVWFVPKRKEHVYHDKACKQTAYRRRKGQKGH